MAIEVRNTLKDVREFLIRAPFDFSNGVTDSTGMIDEGEVRGWEMCARLVHDIDRLLLKDADSIKRVIRKIESL